MTARSVHRNVVLAACALAVLVLPAGSRSENTPTATPIEGGITEIVEVRLVELMLLALDSDDAPVTGLSPDDLELTVNGSARDIAYVRPSVAEHEAGLDLPEVRLGLEVGSIDGGITTRAAPPRYYLLFLDLVNEPFPKGSDAHRDISRFLTEQVHEDDLVGVVSYTGSVRLDLPFTSERDRQLEAVTRAFERKRPPAMKTRQRVQSTSRLFEQCNHVWDSPIIAGEERRELLSAGQDRPVAEANCVQSVAGAFLDDMYSHGGRFLNAVDAALRFAGTIRGGATVLAVSHGVSLQPAIELKETYQSVFGPGQLWKILDASAADNPMGEALDRLIDLGVAQGVTVSFLDPSRPPTGSRSARQAHLLAAGTNPVEAGYAAPRTELRQIASATGGVFLSSTDLFEGLRQVTSRERGRYLMGFYSDHLLSQGDLRSISVTARDRRVSVETGRAYDVRARSSGWASGVFVNGDSRSLGPDRDGRFLSFRLDARHADLDYETVGDNLVADLALHVRVVTADGRLLTDAYRFFRHAFAADRLSGDPLSVLAVRGWLEAEPGAYRLEAMFRNPRSGSEVVVFHEFEVTPIGPAARMLAP